MGQLIQKLKSGSLEVVSVSLLQPTQEQLVIRNYYSVLSAETTGASDSRIQRKFTEKRRSRLTDLNQVCDLIRKNGIESAHGLITEKLDTASPISYSCVGEVLAVGNQIDNLIPGDFIAFGGNSSLHSDLLVVDKNDCIKLQSQINLKEGAFISIASSIFERIRKGKLKKGTSCLVIGLGFTGVLSMKLLKAIGIRPIGIGFNAEVVDWIRNQFGFQVELCDFIGSSLSESTVLNEKTFDSAIITSSIPRSEYIELTAKMVGNGGMIISFGSIASAYDFSANFLKEHTVLEAPLNTDRFKIIEQVDDTNIEDFSSDEMNLEGGMLFIEDLLVQKKLSFLDLVEDVFTLGDVSSKYEHLVGQNKNFLSILIEFNKGEKPENMPALNSPPPKPEQAIIGVIGLGNHSWQVMLPLLKKEGKLIGMATTSGMNTLFADSKYNFSFGTHKTQRLIEREFINTIFIFSRHNLHANQVISSLKAGKHTFIEKPLCLTLDELDKIANVYANLSRPLPNVMLGYNRRFAPAIVEAMKLCETELPKTINLQVYAEKIAQDHWIRDPEIGGGLIIGELCQYVDLACFIAGKSVIAVAVTSSDSASGDNINISLQFEDGSLANILYNSISRMAKSREDIEILFGEMRIHIADYRILETRTSRKKKRMKFRKSKMGYQQEIQQFLRSIHEGTYSPIAFQKILSSTRVSILAQKALQENKTLRV